jgi:hypothetical protein
MWGGGLYIERGFPIVIMCFKSESRLEGIMYLQPWLKARHIVRSVLIACMWVFLCCVSYC